MAEVEKLRKKRKKWTQILAPGFVSAAALGESYIEDPVLLKGKRLKLNLFTINNDIRRQHINLTFSVVDVEGSAAKTDVHAYWLSPSFVKRIVRRNRDRIDDSYTLKSKDGILLRIKPMVITHSNTKRSIRTDMLKTVRAIIKEHVANHSFPELVKQLLEARLQRMIKEKLSKIHPVKSVEFRYFGKEDRTKKETVDIKLVNHRVKKEEEEDEEEDLSEKIKRKEEEKQKQETEEVPEEESPEKPAKKPKREEEEKQTQEAPAEEDAPEKPAKKPKKAPAKKKAAKKDDAEE